MENATEQETTQAEAQPYSAGMFADMYKSYAAHVVPDDAPSFQRRDMKQSYIAGGVAFHSCLVSVLQACGGDGAKFQTLLEALGTEVLAMAEEMTSPEFIEKALTDDLIDLKHARAALVEQDGERGPDEIRVATTAAGLNEDEAKDLMRAIALWIAEATEKRRAAAKETTPTVQ